MKLKSFLKRLLVVEEVIVKINSPINGEILIFEDSFGRKSMRIGKVSQSGGLVINIWQNAIKQISKLPLKPKNCLLLGLGAGGFAKLVAEKWPGIKITGVEIDPLVIEVGKKYFKLDQIPNLIIEVMDVFKKKFAINYDLILVDLYLGQSFPPQAQSPQFIAKIKQSLTDQGVVVFNRFNWGKYKIQAKDFQQSLTNYFPKVWSKKTVSNLLIFCQDKL